MFPNTYRFWVLKTTVAQREYIRINGKDKDSRSLNNYQRVRHTVFVATLSQTPVVLTRQLKLGPFGDTGEWQHVTDISHAGDIHYRPLETETET